MQMMGWKGLAPYRQIYRPVMLPPVENEYFLDLN